jgi:predicted alpha/beta superfamily hydrolase
MLSYHHFDIPALGVVGRTVRVYVPPSYHQSKEPRRYSVVYMHDGQNLFDASTAYARPWFVGAMIDKMPVRKQAIIVGIDNGQALRLGEYSPFPRGVQGGGNGAQYLDFVVHTLKPFIDTHYRTLAEPHHTWMVGSSMGGLITYYAALKYPHIFGKIGILSPAFWFNPQILHESFAGNPHSIRWYVAGSATESNFMRHTLEQTYHTLKRHGIADSMMKVIVRPRGKHNELFWGREFKKMYTEWMA